MRGRAATPEAEAARREKIAAFAQGRFRDAIGRYAPKVVTAEVAGWTVRSREPTEKEDRILGWNYLGPRAIRVRSASPDPDYVRKVLNARDPGRRYWGVVSVDGRSTGEGEEFEL